MIKSGK